MPPAVKVLNELVGGFNLFEKYESKYGNLPQGSGWKFQKYLKYLKPPPSEGQGSKKAWHQLYGMEVMDIKSQFLFPRNLPTVGPKKSEDI